MNDNSEIMFIVPWYPLPRIIKRMNIAKSIAKTGIIFWDKNGNNHYPNDIDKNIDVYAINGNIQDGISTKRIIEMLSFYRRAFHILKKNPVKCIHTTKIDLLLMVRLYCITHHRSNIHVIYEISDLHDAAYNDERNIVKKFVRKFIYFLEKICSKCVDSVIVTSPMFWDNYYKTIYSDKEYLFVPNVSDSHIFQNYKEKKGGTFTIGYVGNLCHYDQLEILIKLSEEINIKVFIAGGGINENRLYNLKRNNKVEFYGRYNFAKDIANLYSCVDCIYALYDSKSKNTKIALPNRLYDAACCGLPLVASKNTYLGDIVERFQIGVTVERNNKEDIKQGIEKLMSIPKYVFQDNARKFMETIDLNNIDKKIKEMYLEGINE